MLFPTISNFVENPVSFLINSKSPPSLRLKQLRASLCYYPVMFYPFQIPLPNYDPVVYTAPVVLAGPYWADPDLMSM